MSNLQGTESHNYGQCTERKFSHEVPRGLLRHVILNLLHDQVLNGVEISQIIKTKTKEKWTPSAGSLYPVLGILENHELIEVISTQGRSKYYQITNLGKEHLDLLKRNHPKLETRINTLRHLLLLFFNPNKYWKFLLSDLQACVDTLAKESETFTPKTRLRIHEKLDTVILDIKKLQTVLKEQR